MTIHALTFVLGVWIFQQIPGIPHVWFLLALIPLTFLAVQWQAYRQFLIPLLIGCLGFAWAVWQQFAPPSWTVGLAT